MKPYFEKILVGVDDSEDAIKAFKYAIHRAIRDDVELIICSVLEDDTLNVYQALDKDYVHGKRDALDKHIREYQQQALDAGVKNVRVFVAEGDAGETIVKTVIPQVHPDLLVIGSKAKKNGLPQRLGSQAAYMVKNTPISVMVVRK
ncbi:universal stress protein UspA-like nucleotide-binding protein [Lactobacillus selangorensis]|uniref:Universal stress protein UspA-like nucleotide-binding protein n=1 Tax=Lactobacillus selangorensis TaxID=81857 RepID=A0A0R2FTP9_9LACO|nr:universal stress protein [Lactobacillus selangorensis]KRN28116.1 universal stress protein UspA-like nucleotide-binding protein [Lactobacillus selangorensis]KRN31007.1 universal stress protein UspA-like nucleotide-binding protein [Lactobacillus selangorensis]